MLQRLYAHNFRCFENFEFSPQGANSLLLIGKNGSGKSTLRHVLRIFQAIGRGTNRLGQLVETSDFAMGRTGAPMRFELDVTLGGHEFVYALALELPERFRELRVLEEKLVLDGEVLYSREHAQVTVRRDAGGRPEAQFNIDWHLVALTVIQDPAASGALGSFRDWLAGIALLAPIPKLMSGDSTGDTEEPNEDAGNVADWLSGLLDRYPSAYSTLSKHLQEGMPDLMDFRFEKTGKDAKTLLVRFTSGEAQFELPYGSLSDGEKCIFLCAVLLSANERIGPMLAFWDEPDNYLSLSEVSQFVLALRRGFKVGGGQVIMTSHNEEAIRRFSNDNTWVLGRRSHLEPTVLRLLDELAPTPDLVQALIDGALEPWA